MCASCRAAKAKNERAGGDSHAAAKHSQSEGFANPGNGKGHYNIPFDAGVRGTSEGGCKALWRSVVSMVKGIGWPVRQILTEGAKDLTADAKGTE